MQIKTGGLLGCSGRTYSSCSVSDTRRVTIKRHEPYFFCISTRFFLKERFHQHVLYKSKLIGANIAFYVAKISRKHSDYF